jgi:tetratricopeptide (TPR) repeat protein
MFNKSIELDPNNINRYLNLGNVYLNMGKLSEAEELVKKTANLNLDNEYLKSRLFQYKSEIKNDIFINKNINSNNDKIFINTAFHYRNLYSKLKERGIKLTVMGYPTLEIKKIKAIFREENNILFISNKNNFNEALKDSKYEEYFRDDFSKNSENKVFQGNYGHATPTGNYLIAENAAISILNELKME